MRSKEDSFQKTQHEIAVTDKQVSCAVPAKVGKLLDMLTFWSCSMNLEEAKLFSIRYTLEQKINNIDKQGGATFRGQQAKVARRSF